MSYSDFLREQADYLDEHPALLAKLEGRYPEVSMYPDDWDEFVGLIDQMGGYKKVGHSGTLTATHEAEGENEWRPRWRVRVTLMNSEKCEQRPKLDEDGNVVTRKVSKYVETDETEPVMEWHCPEVWR